MIASAAMTEAFMRQVIPEPNSGCWLFDCADGPAGYSRFCYGDRVYRAHRISFQLFKGVAPGKLFVCHKCDTPACVNPDHLFLGTQADNMIDMQRKGRGNGPKTVGEDHHRAILTDDLVRAIRADRDSGLGYKRIAKRRSLTWGAVLGVVTNRTWRHVL